MSRVIKTESAGKDRNRLSRAIVIALRELMHQSEPDDLSRDLAAFIVISLMEISETIDVSVLAWEKRGYWVKADRFRLDWEWAGVMGRKMKKALLEDDWATIAIYSVQIAQRLMSIKVSDNHRMGTPWVGAWDALRNMVKE